MVAQFGLAFVAVGRAGGARLAGIGEGGQANGLALGAVDGLPEFVAEGMEAIEAIGDELAKGSERGSIGLALRGGVVIAGVQERSEPIGEGRGRIGCVG